jgi:hypothetical protein
MGQLGSGSPQLQLSAPYAHRPAQPSPVAESRMLSVSSDQPCCHFPSLLVGEESTESRLLILLMGKKPAKPFKEKCFTFRLFFFASFAVSCLTPSLGLLVLVPALRSEVAALIL